MKHQSNNTDFTATWAVIATIIAIVCGIGWASTYNSASSVSSVDTNEVEAEDYENKISEFQVALSDANDVIDESNSCVDDAFSLLDEEYYEDALSQLDSCRYDTVSEPNSL